ncbi:hypothetical protein [Streptomyces sp. NPDC056464]|uniref:hypothetical protein n=1 Tax=Streptomyces sp. NPDC056464 TaxID=3345828 RepID=UPI0036BFE6FF
MRETSGTCFLLVSECVTDSWPNDRHVPTRAGRATRRGVRRSEGSSVIATGPRRSSPAVSIPRTPHVSRGVRTGTGARHGSRPAGGPEPEARQPGGARHGRDGARARVQGGPGDDELYGGPGPDELHGGPGTDKPSGGTSPDVIVQD